LRGDTAQFIASEFCSGFTDAKWQHLSTINTNGDEKAANTTQKTVNGSVRQQLAHGITDEKRANEVLRDRKYMHKKASRKTHSTNGMKIESRVT